MTTRGSETIAPADVAPLVERIAAENGKRVGAYALRPAATVVGKLLGSFAIADGSGVVLLDGGRELVRLDVTAQSARSVRGRVGDYASARVERDLANEGDLAWALVVAATLEEATRAGAAGGEAEADLRAALFSGATFASESRECVARTLLGDARLGIRVAYDGPALDQNDLDAYLAGLALARACEVTGRMRFVTAAIEERTGTTVDGEALAASVARLCEGTVRLHSRSYDARGHLLEYAAREGDRWQITVAPELASLIDPTGYAAALPIRAKLARPLAKWIHARAFALRADATFTTAELAAATASPVGAELDAAVDLALDDVVALGAPFAGWSRSGDRVVLRSS